MAERILASSELVVATNTSLFSMFSSLSRTSSDESPFKTIVVSRRSARIFALAVDFSINFTLLFSSSLLANFRPILPPPAMTMLFASS